MTWLDQYDDPDPETASGQWTLQRIYDDLGTSTDVAKALNVTSFRMHKWLERRDRIGCPAPIRRLGHIDVYSIEEWRGWFKRWTANRDPEKGWQKTKPHGSGQSFFNYGR